MVDEVISKQATLTEEILNAQSTATKPFTRIFDISVIDECFLQDLYGGHLHTLKKIAEVKTVSGEALPVLGRFLTSVEIAGGRSISHAR